MPATSEPGPAPAQSARSAPRAFGGKFLGRTPCVTAAFPGALGEVANGPASPIGVNLFGRHRAVVVRIDAAGRSANLVARVNRERRGRNA